MACEALPESRNTNFMGQKIVIRQYTRRHNARESRIQRRSLIDALYDIVVINAVAKENILSKTVDLTSANVGRQNVDYINFGEKGVRRRKSAAEVSTDGTLPKLVIRIPAARPLPAAVPPHALPIRSGELSPLRSVRVGPALAVEHPESPA